ncbi:MAG: chloride channel protein [Chloroflexi bacterium]|nr:chloride channel protein [Chloroflexota bacterium]
MGAQLRKRLAAQIDGSSRAAPLLLAAFVGLATGLGAVAFTTLIDGVHALIFDLLWEDLLGSARWSLLLMPAIGALLVGPIIVLFAREAKGHGVPEVMLAVATRGGRIRARVAVAKAAASALTIGSGGAAGKEGPIVQIGAAIGSSIGRWLLLSEDTLRLLVAAGAAAGIAATFNAPIAGVFFALEVILRNFNTRNFSVVVLASVVATVTAVMLRGNDPAITIPAYELEHPAEVGLYALLGALCAVVAVGFIRLLYWSEDSFARLRVPPEILMPVVGGLIVGALALWDAGLLGLDDATTEQVLRGDESFGRMARLLLLGAVGTAATIGSGGSGGVFRPSLFLGAMTGGVFGAAAHGLFPGVAPNLGAYATVGMAAVFAGAARAPITAVLIIFEMTRDYELIVPLMTAVAVATVVSQLLSPGTIYTIKLARRGVHIDEEQAPVSLMQTIHVADAMSPVTLCVAPGTSAAEIIRQSSSDPESVTLMLNERGAVVGIITNTDLNRALADGRPEEFAEAIATRDVITIFADETLDDALRIFAGRAITALPVVQRDDDAMLPVGVLRRSDITQAYAQVVGMRETAERRRRLAPVAGDDVRYLELEVRRGSGADGKLLTELGLTEDAVIVAVRHRGATHIPRGHTRLYAGDRVTVIAARGAVGEVRARFESPGRAR